MKPKGTMTLRDRLAQIIRDAHFAAHPDMQFGYPEADALIRAGVALLPCRAGDTVWCTSKTKIVQAKVDSINISGGPEYGVELSFNCEADWSQSYCGEWSCSGEYGETVVGSNDFGKTVFLEREEAETVLKKLESGERLQ